MDLNEMVMDVEQNIEVDGPIDEVFKTVLYRFGKGNTTPDGASMQMEIEEFAGGRWYRDRGEGVQHLWGHVQVIKPPVLIELSGPMFMSYPVVNHLEVKLAEADGRTSVTLRHRAIGMLDPQHREGLVEGWTHHLDLIKKDFEK